MVSLLRRRYMARAAAPVQVRALKFEGTVAGAAASVRLFNNNGAPELYYSWDGMTWNQWNYSALSCPKGTPVYIRGNNPAGFATSSSFYSSFIFTVDTGNMVDCEGDVTSLIDYANKVDKLPSEYCFYHLFINCVALRTAPEFPSTTLSAYCYRETFKGCTGLMAAPALPALRASTQCYNLMFDGCTSLETAPDLPATTLNSSCYNGMFRNCTALRTAPAVLPAMTLYSTCYALMFLGCTQLQRSPRLPAKTLVPGCYRSMFLNCSSLSEITALFLTAPGTSYTANWVQGVAASGTFTKSARATWQTTGINGVPTGWTITTE